MAVSLLPVSVLAAEDESKFPYKGTPVVTYTNAGRHSGVNRCA